MSYNLDEILTTVHKNKGDVIIVCEKGEVDSIWTKTEIKKVMRPGNKDFINPSIILSG